MSQEPPSLAFDPWNILPCLSKGQMITHRTYQEWDEVTHMFIDDWSCKLIVSDSEAYHMTIKKGFVCDGGSIPRFYHSVIKPWGKISPAFFIHDVLYASEKFDRKKCDWLLLVSCQALGVSWYTRNKIYLAVRAFGSLAWNKHDDKSVKAANASLFLRTV